MTLFQHNDSDITLATPPPLASTMLDFDRDDVFNASVYFRCSCPSAASPLYTIKTSGPLTVVRRHDVPIAAIERSSIAPDYVTLWPSTPSTPGMYVNASLSGNVVYSRGMWDHDMSPACRRANDGAKRLVALA